MAAMEGSSGPVKGVSDKEHGCDLGTVTQKRQPSGQGWATQNTFRYHAKGRTN
jgi:hypothetical protein